MTIVPFAFNHASFNRQLESVQSDSRLSHLFQVQAMLPKVGASAF